MEDGGEHFFSLEISPLGIKGGVEIA